MRSWATPWGTSPGGPGPTNGKPRGVNTSWRAGPPTRRGTPSLRRSPGTTRAWATTSSSALRSRCADLGYRFGTEKPAACLRAAPIDLARVEAIVPWTAIQIVEALIADQKVIPGQAEDPVVTCIAIK